ncbi:hypothetical protein A8C32_02890 [Flavivirga aquatica]|uniref:Porin domain-containing protein n=2 Tax=Flavivirga aquatica TaxID=1849968 RepID=A0A1E5TAJ5_9FLAO|nr:hypothetical protein A8C32_02890 [Flavivirga aquatica]
MVFSQGLLDGFTAVKGDVSITGSYTYSYFKALYAGKKKKENIGKSTQNIGSIYAKYGLTSRLLLVGNLAYIKAERPKKSQKVSGLQDFSVALKFNTYKHNFKHSNLNIITALGATIPASDYEVDKFISIGNGAASANFTAGLHFKTNSGVFVTILDTYSVKGDADNDGVGEDYDVPNTNYIVGKFGYASSLIYLEGWIDYTNSIDGPDLGSEGYRSGGYSENEVDFTRIGVTAYKNIIPSLGVSIGYSTVIEGRNMADSTSFSIGLTTNL